MNTLRTSADLVPSRVPTRWASRPLRSTAISLPPDRWALAMLHRPLRDTKIRFRLWDGTAVGVEPPRASATLVIRNRRVLVGLLVDPEMAFGDGYACGAIDVEGDILALLDALYSVFPDAHPIYSDWFRSNTRLEPRDNLHYHYELGNDFYQLWLDDARLYSCAYFAEPTWTLEQAQRAKLDYVCRKLRLRPGDRVIEVGCGWGALAMHMASQYGVGVKAYNISHEQIMFARDRARREGIGDRVEFIEDDYRNIQGRADVFVSLSMLEHVGPRYFGEVGAVLDRTLDSRHGRGVLHVVGRNSPQEVSAWIRRRIFPGAYAPTLGEVVETIFEPRHFSVLDVENLRLHYATTFEHWLARFDRSAEQVQARHGEPFVRAWRLYLAGSLVAFRTGSLQHFQVSFARPGANDIPRTRAYLYSAPGPERNPA